MSEQLPTNTTLPWLHLSRVSAPSNWLRNPVEVYVLAKQGKSLRYQLWKLETVAQSNAQLREMDPKRAGDGSYYVLPPGGVEEGLAGQVVLLYTSQTNWSKEHMRHERRMCVFSVQDVYLDWVIFKHFFKNQPVFGLSSTRWPYFFDISHDAAGFIILRSLLGNSWGNSFLCNYGFLVQKC